MTVSEILDNAHHENASLLAGLELTGPPFSITDSLRLMKRFKARSIDDLSRQINHYIDSNRRQLAESNKKPRGHFGSKSRSFVKEGYCEDSRAVGNRRWSRSK